MSAFLTDAAKTSYIEADGVRFAYRSFGAASGVPLVFTHRFRATMDDWDPAFLDVLARERPIILFDNAGIGLSSGDSADSIAGMAKSAAEFIVKAGHDTVDVFGWSMGGAVAQQLALDRPDLVRRVVLNGTGPGGAPDAPRTPDKVWEVALKPAYEAEDLLYLFFAPTETSRAAGRTHLQRMNKRQEAPEPPVKLETIKAQVAALGAWAAGKNSAYARLAEIAMPVLIANGSHDIMVHAYLSYIMTQHIPNSRLTLYPDAGHGFMFQYPELFGGHVLEFLR